MKMSGLLSAAIVLAVLSGTLYWSNRHKPAEDNVKTSAEPPKILTLNQADVSKIEVKKKGQEGVVLAKNSAGKWEITAPNVSLADQDTVSSMLSTLSPLGSDRLIEEKADRPDVYGLSQPALELDITEKNNKTDRLLIGNDTPSGSAAYAALSGDPRVFTMASYNKSSLDKGFNDLRDKRLLTFDSEKLSRIELTAKKETIEFGRSKDQWQILKPKALRADQSAVEELVRSLHDAKMELSASDDEKKSASAFNSGTPVATVKLTDVSGTQELQVRKNKDDYYAKSTAAAGIYKVASSMGTSADKSLDDFRNKKLFDFGFVDPDKIEVHDGAKSYFLIRSGSDWWSNGTKMDESTVSMVIGAIRDLSATKFPDSSFTTPLITITVTSDGGKRTEKMLISKNGDRYVAQRENEPSLYEIAASSVTDLQNSAAALKPAAPPAPAKK